jgi:hypothetical protein
MPTIGVIMTVQDLIDELSLIKDKTLPVKTYDADMGDWLPAGFTDYDDFVGIG